MAFEYFYEETFYKPDRPDRRGKWYFAIGVLLTIIIDVAFVCNFLWILGK